MTNDLSPPPQNPRPEVEPSETTPTRPGAAALVGLDKRCADMLADEVDVLIRRKVIDSRSPAADALLDYRNPPSTSRSERLAYAEKVALDLEKQVTALTTERDQARSLNLKSLQSIAEKVLAQEERDALQAENKRLREALEETQGLLSAILLETRPATEIDAQMRQNRAAHASPSVPHSQCGATKSLGSNVRGIAVCTLKPGHQGYHRASAGWIWSSDSTPAPQAKAEL